MVKVEPVSHCRIQAPFWLMRQGRVLEHMSLMDIDVKEAYLESTLITVAN